MRHSLRLLSAFLAAIITLMTALPSSHAQPYGAEQAQPPRDEHPIKQLWRKADQSLHNIELIHVYNKYCKPPEEPNIETTQWEIDFEQEELNTLAHEFATLQATYLNSFKTAIGASFRAGFPPLDGYTPFDNEYWAKTRGLLTRNQNALNAKQEALNKRKEEDCSGKKTATKPPPPAPPSTDPGIRLPAVTVRPVEIPRSPSRFCSEGEKQAAIFNLTKVGFDFYLNFQSAREYHDTIAKALERGQGNADVLRRLLPDAKKNLDLHTKRHDDYERELARVRAMPVVDCDQKQPQPPPDATPIPQPDYAYFVWPAVPDRFCSEREKQAVLSQLEAAEGIAKENRAKAKAHAADIQKRLDAGDRTPGLPEAKRDALQAESRFHAVEIQLDDAYHKALAMPVRNCVTRGAELGAAIGVEEGLSPPPAPPLAPPPPPAPSPPPPATESGKPKEFGIRYEGGYIEADTPQQFIGRIVIGGDDTAMIYTSPTLAGFYAQVEADQFWDQSLRYAGEFSGFRIAATFSDVDGDEYRRVEADPAITTGFVWIDPLDSGIPFPVGLGSTNLAWDARTSTEQIDAAAMALYMEYRSFSSDLTGGVGVGVMANYRNTEHRTRIENLDFAGFAIDENYDFETFGLGPRVEARLDWNSDRADGPFPSFGGTLRAYAAGTYDWRSSEVSQRATGPFFGGFDYAQRVELDDDGFNVRYGVDATLDVKFDTRTTAFLKVGWQGQSDAPTIVPADGSFAPGAPISAATEDASEWLIGGGVRIKF
jgi:hypothetical protein